MNALLVSPEWSDTCWSFTHALPFDSKRSASPPLGLLPISPLLPKNWKKKLADFDIRPLADVDLEWADLVSLSGKQLVQITLPEPAGAKKP